MQPNLPPAPTPMPAPPPPPSNTPYIVAITFMVAIFVIAYLGVLFLRPATDPLYLLLGIAAPLGSAAPAVFAALGISATHRLVNSQSEIAKAEMRVEVQKAVVAALALSHAEIELARKEGEERGVLVERDRLERKRLLTLSEKQAETVKPLDVKIVDPVATTVIEKLKEV